ncbi:hypothetical protein RCL1_003624 [Eukaryota sp. TZLM3-RCL]
MTTTPLDHSQYELLSALSSSSSFLLLQLHQLQVHSFKYWKHIFDSFIPQLSSTLSQDLWNEFFQLSDLALTSLSKMPSFWELILKHAPKSRRITQVRRLFDRALQSLPLTQHYRIWPLFLDFCRLDHVPHQTSAKIIHRFLRFDPMGIDVAIEFFKFTSNPFALFKFFKQILVKNQSNLIGSKSRESLWLELAEISTSIDPKDKEVVDFDPSIIYDGIKELNRSDTGSVGRLWVSLATCFMNFQSFSTARNVFIEGLSKVTSKADFAIIYDSYLTFEEKMIENLAKINSEKVKMMVSKMEHFLTLRPFLLNSVDLRLNPFSIPIWVARARLLETFEGNHDKSFDLLISFAVSTLPPCLCTGKFYSLYVMLARHRLKISQSNLIEMRKVFQHGFIQECWKSVERSKLVTSWAESELIYDRNHDSRLQSSINSLIIGLALDDSLRPQSNLIEFFEGLGFVNNGEISGDTLGNQSFISQNRQIFHSKISFPLVEFTESNASLCTVIVPDHVIIPESIKNDCLRVGNFDLLSCRKSVDCWYFLYDLFYLKNDWHNCNQIFELSLEMGLITTKWLLHHTKILQSKLMAFELSFSIYERSLSSIPKSELHLVYLNYLTEFVSYFKGFGIERFRFLSRDALSKVPRQQSKSIRILSFYTEAMYGRPRYAANVLKQSIPMVDQNDRVILSDLLIGFVLNHFGLEYSRSFFETIISNCDTVSCIKFCAFFAKLEVMAGEINRARTLYSYGAKLCSPSSNLHMIWSLWKSFELKYGDEISFNEFNSVKRVVTAHFDKIEKESEIQFVVGNK